jgi:hypothetical protein
MNVRQLKAAIEGLHDDLEVVVYDPNGDVNLGTPEARVMVEDASGGLWLSDEEAQANADLCDVDPLADEVPVTGVLTKVFALRLSA